MKKAKMKKIKHFKSKINDWLFNCNDNGSLTLIIGSLKTMAIPIKRIIYRTIAIKLSFPSRKR